VKNLLAFSAFLAAGFLLGSRRARKAGPIEVLTIEVDATQATTALRVLGQQAAKTAAHLDEVASYDVKNAASEKQLAAAFTEWERRFREEPERFESESQKLAGSPESYGDACAAYILLILAEQAA
jgi:hypothetical protein